MLRTSAIVAASFIAGVSAVQLLHAQSKAPVYSVSVIDIKDTTVTRTPSPTCASASATWAANISSLLASQDRVR